MDGESDLEESDGLLGLPGNFNDRGSVNAVHEYSNIQYGTSVYSH